MKLAIVVATLVLALPGLAAAKPLFQPWIDGTAAAEPQMQVQRYDADTYVVRQSVKTNFEAPFLYLLFGKDRALLLDTGAGGLQVRPTIDGVVADWLKAHHRSSIPLVVAHSHSHGDHRMGDEEFKDRPDTVVVGWTAPEVATFFRIADWPNQIVKFDLGGRALDIIPTPGHHPSHIMVFDERTRLLLSGDSLYPGRLYFPKDQFAAYRDSVDRAVAFTRDRHVSHILGAHIEMTATPGKDFADAAPTHPDERALDLPYADLLALQAAVHRMGETPGKDVHDDFIVFPLPPRPAPPKPAG
ncbi:MBL fold metallo-hydrolase [Phenylobacterium sp.]|jgi:glyoxylase-like metal-dependent hydrolase (beta-lactamase superfamily II)|uniref:MBL fold metallo-hydrolase n=1 Tax=Phenylobacterium sp. TaxID=1871053 RepID=UPI002E313C81|nr:MBL fold metallo-hydrolase [Phenylobacterium sp.]HEX4710185.1 MBL fold metallo-hydrolase [Phenylobacterium sp.]